MSNYWNEKRLISSDKIKPIKKSTSTFYDKGTGATYEGYIGTNANLDSEPFIKLFLGEFASLASMSSAGMKVFMMIAWRLQDHKEETFMLLDRRSWQDYSSEMISRGVKIRLNQDTFYRGLRELKELDIVRDGRRDGEYQVNPSVLFNGRRDKAIKRESK